MKKILLWSITILLVLSITTTGSFAAGTEIKNQNIPYSLHNSIQITELNRNINNHIYKIFSLFKQMNNDIIRQYFTEKNKYVNINLNVPNYKQYDTKWKNTIIGKSGKTIGKIGCATTGIAMIESFRQNKSIYPDAMSKKLSYSSSGDLYWPSDYKVVTDSSDYLNKVYGILKSGKPVLFGAKKSSGGQHWVVIVGYKKSDKLSASSFIINDPGSGTRTNLQQFLSDYPVFYKFFTY